MGFYEKEYNVIQQFDDPVYLSARANYQHAVNIIKGPFPLGESQIKKDPYYSYLYAVNILKGPFPKGEPVLMDSEYWDEYTRLFS